eukprot:2354056-Rhodomonas_salina.3
MTRAHAERSQRFLERRSASIKRIQGKGRELDLSNLSLGDKGALECATQLNGNKTLEVLIVSINGIGPEGATSLANVLQSHPTLSALTISRNSIGNLGLQALATSLRSCPHLTELRADFNDIGPALPPEIEELFGLKTLGMRGNKLETFPIHLLKTIDTVDIDDNAPALRSFLEASLERAEDGARKIANRKEAVALLDKGWDLWKDLDMPKAQVPIPFSARICSAAFGPDGMHGTLRRRWKQRNRSCRILKVAEESLLRSCAMQQTSSRRFALGERLLARDSSASKTPSRSNASQFGLDFNQS